MLIRNFNKKFKFINEKRQIFWKIYLFSRCFDGRGYHFKTNKFEN